MTLEAWLHERVAAAPPRLTARVLSALGPDRLSAPSADAARVCIDAAEELLRELLARDSTGRESALDLLTVDALATYAFEAASDEPTTLSDGAADAARRFAAAGAA